MAPTLARGRLGLGGDIAGQVSVCTAHEEIRAQSSIASRRFATRTLDRISQSDGNTSSGRVSVPPAGSLPLAACRSNYVIGAIAATAGPRWDGGVDGPGAGTPRLAVCGFCRERALSRSGAVTMRSERHKGLAVRRRPERHGGRSLQWRRTSPAAHENPPAEPGAVWLMANSWRLMASRVTPAGVRLCVRRRLRSGCWPAWPCSGPVPW